MTFCQIDARDSTAENTVSIEVTKFSENEIVVEISPESTENKESDAESEEAIDRDDESESNNGESTADVASSQRRTGTSVDTEEDSEPVSQFVHAAPHKYRSLSESSGIELVSTLLRMLKVVNFFCLLASLHPFPYCYLCDICIKIVKMYCIYEGNSISYKSKLLPTFLNCANCHR